MEANMRRTLLVISSGLDKLCRSAAVGFLALMLLLVLFQALARYIFQAVPVWTEEAARYCMIWGGLLGATVAFAGDLDPRLVQPPKSGPKVWIVSAGWIRALASVFFLGPVLYHSDRFLRRSWHRASEGMEIPMAFVTVAVPLAIVIIFIHLGARLIPSPDRSDQTKE
jgi:TRAP-type C4-dicarboxylate transport system permease small subunit